LIIAGIGFAGCSGDIGDPIGAPSEPSPSPAAPGPGTPTPTPAPTPTPTPSPTPGAPPVSGNGIAFVQAANFADYYGTPQTTVSLTFPAPTQPGNLIVVAATWGDDSALLYMPSATDSSGNTYVVGTRDFEDQNSQSVAMFYAANIAGGTTKITVS